jgi:hypothetical protein
MKRGMAGNRLFNDHAKMRDGSPTLADVLDELKALAKQLAEAKTVPERRILLKQFRSLISEADKHIKSGSSREE